MRIILISIILCANNLFAQTNPALSLDLERSDKNKRLNSLILIELGTYSLSILGFNELWYKNYEKSNFHFINDNSNWLQMDKMGHVATSYHSGVNGIKLYKWTGINKNKAIWIGGLSGTFFNTTIEILDGFSAEWGASLGDLFANSLGSALAISQELYWADQRIQIKYSYTRSEASRDNDGLFGNSYIERSLKDYNGQTYWVSMNINSLCNIENSQFPDWLNFAIGHSANDMLSPSNTDNDNRYRQFLFSFDIDLHRLEIKNKFLKGFVHAFGFVKIPFPTIEINNGSLQFHPIYF